MKSRVYNSKIETQAAGIKNEMEHIQLEYSMSQYFTAYTKSNCEHFEI
jgi:hypothetical protein